MTKNEMLNHYYPKSFVNNYEIAQGKIKYAMEHGEKYVYLPKEEYESEFSWTATMETIMQLKEDGFTINEMWEPEEYWSVEWEY